MNKKLITTNPNPISTGSFRNNSRQLKTKIAVLITTYKRPDTLRNIISDLKKEAGEYNISYFIYDDTITNHGKINFWKTINALWEKIRYQHFDYYYHLPDDVKLCDHFIGETIKIWESIEDPRKICLNLLLDKFRVGKRIWTDTWPTVEHFGEFRLLRTQWVDLLFLCQQNFFMHLNWRITPISRDRWKLKPTLSSGVGAQISKRLHENGLSMYQVTNSLVEHLGSESKMHPDLRHREPLRAWHLPEICASIACTHQQFSSFLEKSKNIVKYVDKLIVFLQASDPEGPDYQKEAKIQLFRWPENCVDINAAVQYHSIRKHARGEFYFFAIDINEAYPPYYFWTMIRLIESYKRSCIISWHPNICTNKPTQIEQGNAIFGKLRKYFIRKDSYTNLKDQVAWHSSITPENSKICRILFSNEK